MAEPSLDGEAGEGCSDGGGSGAGCGGGSHGDDSGAGNVSPSIVPHEALLEWAAAATADNGRLVSSCETIPEELEGIIRDIAHSGAASGYPWDALRILLARKVEQVLRDFGKESKDLLNESTRYRDGQDGLATQDLGVKEGELFDSLFIEPLTQSLLEPMRNGAPFTAQRLCELLSEPRRVYTSGKKYLYAVQRVILIKATDELLASDKWDLNGNTSLASATRKRKLPPELANGVV